jgi:hypothetical protein
MTPKIMLAAMIALSAQMMPVSAHELTIQPVRHAPKDTLPSNSMPVINHQFTRGRMNRKQRRAKRF